MGNSVQPNASSPLQQEDKAKGQATLSERFKQFSFDPKLSKEEQMHAYITQILQRQSLGPKSANKIPELLLGEKAGQLLESAKSAPLLTMSALNEDLIYQILSSAPGKFFDKNLEKASFLMEMLENSIQLSKHLDSWVRDNSLAGLIDELHENIVRYMSSLLIDPSSFEVMDIEPEDVAQPLDNRNQLFWELFHGLLEERFSLALRLFFRSLELVDDREIILSAIFKRIYAKLITLSIKEPAENYLQIIRVMSQLFKNKYIVHYFICKSPFFANYESGYALQKQTIFGQILGVSTMPEDMDFFNPFNLINSGMGPNFMPNQMGINVSHYQKNLDLIIEGITDLISGIVQEKDHDIQWGFNEWINQALLLNQAFTQTLNETANLSQSGFIINLSKLLLRMIGSALKDQETMHQFYEKLDIDLFLDKKDIFARTSSNIASYQPEKLMEEEITPQKELKDSAENKLAESAPPKSKALTQLLRQTTVALHYTSLLFNKQFNIYQQLRRLKHELGGGNQLQPFMPFGSIKLECQLGDIMLNDPNYTELVIRFYTLQTYIAFSLNHAKVQKNYYLPLSQVKERCTPQYTQFHMCIVEDMNETFQYFSLADAATISALESEYMLCIQFCVILMNFKSWCSNPHLQQGLFQLMLITIKSKELAQIQSRLFSNLVVQEYILPAVLKIYVKNEKQEILNDREKYRFKSHFMHFFSQLINTKGCLRTLKDFSVSEKEIFHGFLVILYTDTLSILNELDTVKSQIQILETQTQQASRLDQKQYLMTKESEYQQNFEQMMQLLSLNITSILGLSNEIGDTLVQDEAKEETAKFINQILFYTYNLTKFQMSNQMSSQISSQMKKHHANIKQYRQIVENILEIFISLTLQHNYFIDLLVDDADNFRLQDFQKICDKYKNLKNIQLLQKLVTKSAAEKQKRDFILKNAPEEFIDPITCNLIVDPIKLPSSQKVLDRVTIKKHLLYDQTDPFNRDFLSEQQIIEVPELREKIDQFLKAQEMLYNEQLSGPTSQQQPEKPAEQVPSEKVQVSSQSANLQNQPEAKNEQPEPKQENTGSKSEKMEEEMSQGSEAKGMASNLEQIDQQQQQDNSQMKP